MIDIKKQISKKVWLGTLFVKSYVEKKDFNFYRELYERYQFLMWGHEWNKKNVWDFSIAFIKLIDNFQDKWFDKNFPIIISREWVPLDGHHRVACCLYFHKFPTYKVNTSISISDYNWLSWILKNTLISRAYSSLEKVIIISEYWKYNQIYYYDSDNFNDKKIHILWCLRIHYKKNKINITITDTKSYSTEESQYIKNIFKKRIKEKDFTQENNKSLSKIIIYTLHVYNKIKRISFEFIKKMLNHE